MSTASLLTFLPADDSPTTNSLFKSEFRATLRLAVYRQLVRLGDKPLGTHNQKFDFPTEHLRL
jgi:hypothetical protein